MEVFVGVMRDAKFIGLVLGLVLIWGIHRLQQIGKRDPRMPKGPPTIPILGNFHQIPSSGLYAKFLEWSKEYGPVFSLKFGPSNIIVLCDRKAIHSLLDRKGAIYSDRPASYVGKLVTQGDHIALEQMDATWREKRKVISHNFSPKNLDEKHSLVQEAEATVLLNDLLNTPDTFFNHAVYDVMDRWTAAMEAGANPPVDEYPFLRWMPTRFAFWKRRAMAAGVVFDTVWSKARRIVEDRRGRGDKRDCIIDTLLDDYGKKGFPMSQHAFNNLVGEVVEGAADTTAAQILTLILAFAKHPHVQKKAQTQIDKVCSSDKIPQFTDFDKIPYVNQVVKEGMRWRPSWTERSQDFRTEFVKVRYLSEALLVRIRLMVLLDDWYEGMLIPKDSTLFVPVWALHHSESVYRDHETFNPDRYDEHPSEPVDPETGITIPLDDMAYNSGILQAPLPFKVQIKPRSEQHAAMIRKELSGSLKFLQAWE
ncbi:cytochrome P450 2D18 [Seiridium cupressi]